MTVNDLITALQSYARVSPQNGSADVVLRGSDGETCFHIDSALNGEGLPGQHYLIFVPQERGSFKMREAMKLN